MLGMSQQLFPTGLQAGKAAANFFPLGYKLGKQQQKMLQEYNVEAQVCRTAMQRLLEYAAVAMQLIVFFFQ